MSRTALYAIALVLTLLAMGVAVLVKSGWVALIAGGVMGLTALVFAHELSEREGTGSYAIPGSRGTRKVVIQVFGVLLLVGSAIGLVGRL